MKDHVRKQFSASLKNARVFSRLKSREMAESLGMTVQNYNRIERGEQAIPSDLLPAISTLVNCSIDELYGLTPPSSLLSEQQALLLKHIELMDLEAAKAVDVLIRLIYAKKISPEMVHSFCSIIRLQP